MSRFCLTPGCGSRVTRGYCDLHSKARKTQHRRLYAGGGFYGRKWAKARLRHVRNTCVYPGF
jgi:hypothetical protein